jgi:hypothetical protein
MTSGHSKLKSQCKPGTAASLSRTRTCDDWRDLPSQGLHIQQSASRMPQLSSWQHAAVNSVALPRGRTFRRRSRSLPEALASKTMPLLKDNDRLPCARGGEARDAARSTTMLSSAVQHPTPEQRASGVTTIKRSAHLVICIPLCSCLHPVLCTAVPGI